MKLDTLYQQTRQKLAAAGIASAALDARLLLGAACKLTPEEMIVHPDRVLTPDEEGDCKEYLARRLAGEPVSRILGRKEFWGMEFIVTPDTLDPRPDTETLVEAALGWARQQTGPLRLLDLGTGTGCILISLLSELPAAQGVGIDISAGAITVSRENARALGVAERADFRQGSWFEPLGHGESFDLIVANPPYIGESAVESLAKEVKNHDPRGALTPGPDEFSAYKMIYPQLRTHLKPAGRAFFEIGFGQAPEIARLVDDSHATLCNVYKDLGGVARVVELSFDK